MSELVFVNAMVDLTSKNPIVWKTIWLISTTSPVEKKCGPMKKNWGKGCFMRRPIQNFTVSEKKKLQKIQTRHKFLSNVDLFSYIGRAIKSRFCKHFTSNENLSSDVKRLPHSSKKSEKDECLTDLERCHFRILKLLWSWIIFLYCFYYVTIDYKI